MQLSPPSGITFAKPAIFRSLRCHVIFLDSLSDIFNWFAEDFNQEGLVGGGGRQVVNVMKSDFHAEPCGEALWP